MPAQQPVANCVQLVIGGVIGPYHWNVVNHYSYSGGAPSETTLLTAATTAFNAFNTNIMPHANGAYILNTAKLTDLAGPTGAQAEVTGSHTGLMNGATVGANVCFLLQKSINRRYRGGHPRTYLPAGDSTVVVSSSSWTPAYTTTYTNAYGAFIVATANGGMWAGVGNEIVVHRKSGHIVLIPPLVDVVQSYNGSQQFASQRRRVGRK